MKKTQSRSNVLDYLSFLFLGLIIAGFLYGGLTINKLTKINQALEARQNQLEDKITGLDAKIIDHQNQLITFGDQLTQNEKKLSYYRKLALDAQAELDKKKIETPPKEVAGAVTTAIKTVTKKVYIETPKYESTLTIEGIGSYKVNVTSGDTAFTILKKASDQYGLKISYDTFSFGVFITEVAGLKPVGNQYWAFYYNGKYSQVGASDQKISAGDTIYWRLESF